VLLVVLTMTGLGLLGLAAVVRLTGAGRYRGAHRRYDPDA
jgi:hypothetical protein